MAQMPFSPPQDDVTVGILGHIFGPIIDVLVKGADPNTVSAASSLLGTLFTFFNSGVLVVGSIIVSYVAVMGEAKIVRIDRHLFERGFSVPEVLAEDPAAGLLLLER